MAIVGMVGLVALVAGVVIGLLPHSVPDNGSSFGCGSSVFPVSSLTLHRAGSPEHSARLRRECDSAVASSSILAGILMAVGAAAVVSALAISDRKWVKS